MECIGSKKRIVTAALFKSKLLLFFLNFAWPKSETKQMRETKKSNNESTVTSYFAFLEVLKSFPNVFSVNVLIILGMFRKILVTPTCLSIHLVSRNSVSWWPTYFFKTTVRFAYTEIRPTTSIKIPTKCHVFLTLVDLSFDIIREWL